MNHPFTTQARFQEFEAPFSAIWGQTYNVSFYPMSELYYEFLAGQWNRFNRENHISREQVLAGYVEFQVAALTGPFGMREFGSYRTTPEELEFCRAPLDAEKAAAWAVIRPVRDSFYDETRLDAAAARRAKHALPA